MENFDEIKTKFQSGLSPLGLLCSTQTPRIMKENTANIFYFFIKGIISIFGHFSGASQPGVWKISHSLFFEEWSDEIIPQARKFIFENHLE